MIEKGSNIFKKILLKVIFYLLLGIGLFYILSPIYIAVLNSLKSNKEIADSLLALPQNIDFSNYITAFGKLNFLHSFLNTFILTTLSVIGIIFCSSLAGYKIARSNNRLGVFFYIVIIASMLIPFHSIMISLTRTAMALGVKGSILGTVTIYIGLGINMAVFLYTGFVNTIPRELEEASIIDGCGPFSTFFYIVLPLLKPITSTIAILDALWIWNDFLLPLLLITKADNYTLILSANKFFGKYTTDWSSIMAGLLMTSIPLIIFYLFFQKHIVKGIAAGAVKG